MKMTSPNRNSISLVTSNSRVLCLVLFLFVCMTGCSMRSYPDLSSYRLDEFINHEATCKSSFQCRVIGYGISGSCNYDSNFNGYVIYSTKMGRENIQHLKNLVAESRGGTSRHSNQLDAFSFSEKLEECTPARIIKPKLACLENICRSTTFTD